MYTLLVLINIFQRKSMTKKKSRFERLFIQVQKFVEDLYIQAQDELTTKTRRTCGNFNTKE